MPLQVYHEDRIVWDIATSTDLSVIKQQISDKFHIPPSDLYATVDGKTASDDECLPHGTAIRFYTRLVGGKGGFGSMLRAIGAQIEKTTNREACRDLSGRRLRDINEEKRLRKWLDGQADREKEAIERKQKKLERLVAEPKIDVNLNDSVYEKERQGLPERVSAAVDAGWQAAGTSEGTKRKIDAVKDKGKKKKKLWIDAELSDCSSSSGDEAEDEVTRSKSSPGPAVSTDSGNESDRGSEVSNKVVLQLSI